MLITRCAWHRRYHGYSKVLGISTWRGLQVAFTDGICQKCAARVRADHLRSHHAGGGGRRRAAWGPGLAVVSVTVALSLVLIARPTHEPPEPFPMVVAPPVVVEPPAVVEPPQPSAAPATIVAAGREDSFPAAPRSRLRPRAERPVVGPTRTVALASDVGWIPYVFAVVRNASTLPMPPRRANGREHTQSP